VLALRHAAADGSWDAAVTVVRARRLPLSAGQASGGYARDPRSGYDLNSPGELVYEVQVHEDDDGGSGHGPRPLVTFELAGTPQAAADVVRLWAARGSLFACTAPRARPEAATRQEKRRYDHRQAAAAAPDLDTTAVPPQAADLATEVDPAMLCWFFPRERGGRYRRSALVALAPCRDGRPHLSGPWLTARADGDHLVLEVRDLIPANQAHRWDAAPWLWNRRHADAPPARRWQARDIRGVRPAFTALRDGRLQSALGECGVLADPEISRLLAGQPTRLFRAELTGKWVASLHAGLADAAPWRLAAACQAWREDRDALGLRTTRPVTLFGLGGMRQARKPKAALDLTPPGRCSASATPAEARSCPGPCGPSRPTWKPPSAAGRCPDSRRTCPGHSLKKSEPSRAVADWPLSQPQDPPDYAHSCAISDYQERRTEQINLIKPSLHFDGTVK